MGPRDIAVVALTVGNVLAIAALLLWWARGQRRGPFRSNGQWRYLAVYYSLILGVLVEATVVGVLLTALPE